jgi:hypothetical protein
VRAGLTDGDLAAYVGVDPSAVPALIRLATVKLLELDEAPGGAAPGGAENA